MKKNQKNDVSNSTMPKGFLDKFMEEFFKVENECDLECFYELLNKCFLEDCKTNLKNHKITCLEEMKELVQKNLYDKKTETISDILFMFVAGILVVVFLPTSLEWLLLLPLMGVLFIKQKIQEIRKISKGTKETIFYLEEVIVEEKQKLETIKKQELEEIQNKEEKLEEDPLKPIIKKAQIYFDYGFNYKKWMLYYKMGVLKSRLEKKYNEEECDKIENLVLHATFKKEENSLLRKLER